MILTNAVVGPYRSINNPQNVSIDPEVTVLVGMNEAGKTVFLKALHKANDALIKESFNLPTIIHAGISRHIYATMIVSPKTLSNLPSSQANSRGNL